VLSGAAGGAFSPHERAVRHPWPLANGILAIRRFERGKRPRLLLPITLITQVREQHTLLNLLLFEQYQLFIKLLEIEYSDWDGNS